MGGRRYTVDTHPQREHIIKDIAKGESTLREIAKKYRIAKSTLHDYLKRALIPRAAEIKAKNQKSGQDLIDELEAIKTKAYKMLNACDEYLTDPEDPQTYYLGPQAHEVQVSYKEQIKSKDGKYTWISKKTDLQSLLARVNEGKEITHIHYTYTDPRKLLLEATRQLYGAVELSGKIVGEIKESQIQFISTDGFVQIQQILLDSLSIQPELRRTVASRLDEMVGELHHD